MSFIEHTVYHHVTPKFTKIKGHFLQTRDRIKTERSVLFSNLKENKKSMCSLSNVVNKLKYLRIM